MSKANLSTDGGLPIGLRSEFYSVFSANADDAQPIDLSGAREVIFQMDSSQMDGWLTGDDGPLGSAQQFFMANRGPAIVFHSNDDRLYFRSTSAAPANLFVWVIR